MESMSSKDSHAKLCSHAEKFPVSLSVIVWSTASRVRFQVGKDTVKSLAAGSKKAWTNGLIKFQGFRIRGHAAIHNRLIKINLNTSSQSRDHP
jgi:hypothetical protein